MLLAEYRIEHELFGGPLSLLLYLVRRKELDICRFSLAKITQDFCRFVDLLEFLDLELVAEFVVVAGTLLEIKSREVLPAPEEKPDEIAVEDDEPTGDLILKLLEYKRYKNAARQLQDRADDWLERYPRLSSDKPDLRRSSAADKIREVELWDLVSALARVIPLPDATEHTSIRMDEIPISVFQERIRERIRSERRVAFSSFFEGEKIRSRIVGIFQAILELVRHEYYRCEQPTMYGEIWVLPPEAAPSTEGGSLEPGPPEADAPEVTTSEDQRA